MTPKELAVHIREEVENLHADYSPVEVFHQVNLLRAADLLEKMESQAPVIDVEDPELKPFKEASRRSLKPASRSSLSSSELPTFSRDRSFKVSS